MIRRTTRKRLLTAAALVTGVSLLAAGCTGGGGEGEGDGEAAAGRTLNIWAGTQTPVVANFNPYSPNPLHAANGAIYEPLFYYNKAQASEPEPRLGQTMEWSEDGLELTVTLREGVKWTDGEDFDADDVVFSQTNAAAQRDFIESVEALDTHTVKWTFSSPQFTSEVQLLGTAFVVPEHIFAEVDDLVTFTNENPVGTGPFKFDSVTEAAYTVVANEDYWDGAPKLEKVRYLGIDQNQSAEDLMTTGKVDWTAMFVADPDRITADGRLSMLNTPQNPTTIYSCVSVDLGCEGPQTDVAVRQALNLAMDRTEINEKAFAGLSATASPTFALLGRDDRWISPDVEAESPQSADPEAAAKVLEDAGYTKGADGIYEKDGQKVEMDLITVDGWNDYNALGDLFVEDAKAAGIALTHTKVSQQEMSDARAAGTYELMVGGITGTALDDPFQIYRQWMSTEYTLPVGEVMESGKFNFVRYTNPKLDAAVSAAAATEDEAAKQEQYAIIQEEIARDLPYIPVVVNATQTFMDTKDFTGWPTEDDLYAFPPSWENVANGIVLSKLEPKS
ncbi:ABC transporter substrate-binding protein [Cellulosimicrobium marinum]|uniref:ABC transporter substrate-binding protein n=1 Tax=Cellulosimicrobium marinum TaxID=1638992 RepID=UPI001E438EAA|nr:ABC transporter substrate-binding protein [Cellulosimicrobium marinum]MCB7135177.1 ABC transporter substrate-binding protein [Cellulosimicrobium marinum]